MYIYIQIYISITNVATLIVARHITIIINKSRDSQRVAIINKIQVARNTLI